MGTSERRNEIVKLLCRRRHETIANLASEFGVSARTIRRDIEVLSLSEPIYTQTGRYGGGVYVVDDFAISRMYMAEEELYVLKKICDIAEKEERDLLTYEELKIVKGIVEDYSKPAQLRKEKDYEK